MGLLDRFIKKKKVEKPEGKKASVKASKKTEKKYVKEEKKPKKEERILSKEVKEVTKPKKVNKEDTKEAYRILIRPLVTEKATSLGIFGKYIFEVAPRANKIEIKKAIQHLYGVNVVQVNVVNRSGKAVRYGRSTGRTKDWKKAIVTLRPGEKIEIYEGV